MKRWAFVWVTIILICFANTAMAENAHGYHGTYCKPAIANSNAVNYSSYGIYNQSRSTQVIVCPVLTDELAVTTGTTKVWVYWTAGALSDTIGCTLSSRNGNGAPRQSRSASKTGSGWFRIANITTDDFWGSYTMLCTLPSSGLLSTISLHEQN